MSQVDLGFLEESLPWKLESRLFPSKVGGKPAWLDLKNLPSPEALVCSLCSQQMIFLCQIYAPYEEDENNFHRTLFIFVCRSETCSKKNKSDNFKVFRSNLRRENEFYPFESPEEKPDVNFNPQKWVQLCKVCGCKAEKLCSNCKTAAYCCRKHQVIDWKNKHKESCGKNEEEMTQSSLLFPEWELVIEPEEEDDNNCADNEKEMDLFMKLKEENKIGSLANITEKELSDHVDSFEDKEFLKFHKRIKNQPEQVIRYQRSGNPLYIAKVMEDVTIPDCNYCGKPRKFEFQIMPQMLTFLKEIELDWGVLLIYTCQSSCGIGGYKEEFIVKQDISDSGKKDIFNEELENE